MRLGFFVQQEMLNLKLKVKGTIKYTLIWFDENPFNRAMLIFLGMAITVILSAPSFLLRFG
jgi:hypothetical protein